MLDALAAMDLPWRSVHVFQVDERVAPDGDPERNAVQLTEHLLTKITIPKRNVHLMGVTSASLPRAAAAYATALGDEPLDLVHLGCGEDGHTASWPPGDPVIDAPGRVAMCGMFNGCVRMTILPIVVNSARARLVLAVGSGKASPLAGWLLQRADLPISRVRRTATTLITDAAGAAQLSHD
jgi:6-phosphogluconolactonase/glucosamine-6-phosphate isomerase/deaminase